MKVRVERKRLGDKSRHGALISALQLSSPLLPALSLILIVVLMLAGLVAGQEAREGTLLFLHVWKCGGTSLRKLLCDWAREEGLPCATVATCRSLSLDVSGSFTQERLISDEQSRVLYAYFYRELERKICLVNHKLIFRSKQEPFIAEQRVLAGHFRWGFQSYAAEPYTMVTTLRNPLELFVSGEQYLHRKATKTLSQATKFVSSTMLASLGRHPAGFLHRFVGHDVVTPDELRKASIEAALHMRTFSLVGVVEQYEGFITVLKTLVDPSGRQAKLWHDHVNQKLNASPVQSTEVLAGIDPVLVERFNESLSYQWLLYGHAVRLYEEKCREVLPQHLQSTLCYVPNPPVAYY